MTTKERLEKLELQLNAMKRHNRCLLVIVGLIIGAWFLPVNLIHTVPHARAQDLTTVPDTIFARNFILEDEKGNPRASLSMGKEGPNLTLFSEKKIPAASLNVSGLGLYDEKGKTRIGLTLIKDGPGLSLYDEKGNLRVGLNVLRPGPTLGLVDEYGNPRIMIMLHAGKNEPSLGLLDEMGNIIWSAP